MAGCNGRWKIAKGSSDLVVAEQDDDDDDSNAANLESPSIVKSIRRNYRGIIAS